MHAGGDGHALRAGEEREHPHRCGRRGRFSAAAVPGSALTLLSSCVLCVCAAVVRGAPPDLVLRLVEEPEFRYEDFAPRGEHSPPVLRAQVVRERASFEESCVI